MISNREGQRVPSVTLKTREKDQWVDRHTDSIFRGKKVIVFSLPGAYTPTCSSAHVPRYSELAPTFKANGIDEICCISVNDAFVMEAWQKTQKAENVTFLPDGNGDFSKEMGVLVDKSDLGFGKRSWRYSMLVDDGVIRKMFIEPDKEGDPFEVSDADTMLRFVAPEAREPEFVSVIVRAGCPHCARAKKLLADHQYPYEEIPLGETITSKSIRAITGRSTVPQVFIGGRHIGGADDLEKHLREREEKSASAAPANVDRPAERPQSPSTLH